MKSILDQLYNGEYNIAGRETSSEYRKRAKELVPYLDEIEQVLGEERMTDFDNARAAVGIVEEKEAFREGFLLGVRLMLEVLRETNTASL